MQAQNPTFQPMPQNITPQSMPQHMMPQPMFQQMPQPMPQPMPQNIAPQSMPQHMMQQSIPQNQPMPQQMPQPMPNQMPQPIPQQMPNQIPQTMPQNVTHPTQQNQPQQESQSIEQITNQPQSETQHQSQQQNPQTETQPIHQPLQQHQSMPKQQQHNQQQQSLPQQQQHNQQHQSLPQHQNQQSHPPSQQQHLQQHQQQQSTIGQNPMNQMVAANSSSGSAIVAAPKSTFVAKIVNFWEIDASRVVFGKIEKVEIGANVGYKCPIKYRYFTSQGDAEGAFKIRFPKRITEKQARDPNTNELLVDENGNPIVTERLSGTISNWGVGSRENERGGLNWSIGLDLDITGRQESLENYVNREKAEQYYNDYLDYVDKIREGCRRVDLVYKCISDHIVKNKNDFGLSQIDLGPLVRANVIDHILKYKMSNLEDGSIVRDETNNPAIRPKLSHYTTEKGDMIASNFYLPDGSPVIPGAHPEQVWRALEKKSLDVDGIPHIRDIYSNCQKCFIRKGMNKAVILDWWERQAWSEQQETIDTASQLNMSAADSMRHALANLMAFAGGMPGVTDTMAQTDPAAVAASSGSSTTSEEQITKIA